MITVDVGVMSTGTAEFSHDNLAQQLQEAQSSCASTTAAAGQQVEQLQQQLAAAQYGLTALESTHKQLQELQQQQQQLHQAWNRHLSQQACHPQLEVLRQQLAKTEQDLALQQQRNKHLERQATIQQQQLEQAVAAAADTQQQLRGREMRVAELEHRVDQLRADYTKQLDSLNKELNEQQDYYQKRLASADDTADFYEEQWSEAQQYVKQLEKEHAEQLQGLRQKHAADLQQLRDQHAAEMQQAREEFEGREYIRDVTASATEDQLLECMDHFEGGKLQVTFLMLDLKEMQRQWQQQQERRRLEDDAKNLCPRERAIVQVAWKQAQMLQRQEQDMVELQEQLQDARLLILQQECKLVWQEQEGTQELQDRLDEAIRARQDMQEQQQDTDQMYQRLLVMYLQNKAAHEAELLQIREALAAAEEQHGYVESAAQASADYWQAQYEDMAAQAHQQWQESQAELQELRQQAAAQLKKQEQKLQAAAAQVRHLTAALAARPQQVQPQVPCAGCRGLAAQLETLELAVEAAKLETAAVAEARVAQLECQLAAAEDQLQLVQENNQVLLVELESCRDWAAVTQQSLAAELASVRADLVTISSQLAAATWTAAAGALRGTATGPGQLRQQQQRLGGPLHTSSGGKVSSQASVTQVGGTTAHCQVSTEPQQQQRRASYADMVDVSALFDVAPATGSKGGRLQQLQLKLRGGAPSQGRLTGAGQVGQPATAVDEVPWGKRFLALFKICGRSKAQQL